MYNHYQPKTRWNKQKHPSDPTVEEQTHNHKSEAMKCWNHWTNHWISNQAFSNPNHLSHQGGLNGLASETLCHATMAWHYLRPLKHPVVKNFLDFENLHYQLTETSRLVIILIISIDQQNHEHQPSSPFHIETLKKQSKHLSYPGSYSGRMVSSCPNWETGRAKTQ